jgi:hypothetical protein
MATFTATGTVKAAPQRAPSHGLVVLGSVLLVIGLVLGTIAAALVVALGPRSELDSGPQQLSTPTTALVTSAASADGLEGLGAVLGSPSVRVSVAGDRTTDVFVGIGPADAVSEYLAGAAVDEATDITIDPFLLDVARRPGTSSVAPPEDQDFWVASTTAAAGGTLVWPLQQGDYRIVVMNANGASGVGTPFRLQIGLPRLFPVSVGVLLASAAVSAVGGVILAVVLRRSRHSSDAPFQMGRSAPWSSR